MTTFALVDCNNFYASCEKLFRPDLRHVPLVVLSNNDGCIVARSKEAKTLGIKMGAPLHQVKDQLTYHNVAVFSSNYALYGDISNRVMETLAALAPAIEIYSIDEAFLDLTGVSNCMDLAKFGFQIKNTVQKNVGIGVGVGIAPTKTLAKLANHAAKQYSATKGVVDLTSKERQAKLLKLMPLREVWGVGGKLCARLQAQGIKTAWDLASQSPKAIRQKYSVVLERTVSELNGESCLSLEEIAPLKQQIICSRSFGTRITQLADMQEAVANHVARGAAKLRYEQQRCQHISVFIHTSAYNPKEPHYSNNASFQLPTPTSDTRILLTVASRLLKHIWQNGFNYARAGIMLGDFHPQNMEQALLFEPPSVFENKPRNSQLMQLIDKLNQSPNSQVFFARQGVENNWKMKRQRLSPSYTTNWKQLPWVR